MSEYPFRSVPDRAEQTKQKTFHNTPPRGATAVCPLMKVYLGGFLCQYPTHSAPDRAGQKKLENTTPRGVSTMCSLVKVYWMIFLQQYLPHSVPHREGKKIQKRDPSWGHSSVFPGDVFWGYIFFVVVPAPLAPRPRGAKTC